WMKDHGGVIINIIADMWKGFLGWPTQDNLNVGTIISKTAMENYKDIGPTMFKMSVPFSPAKRLGVPEEVSPAVCFLLSPAASYITGATLKVDAGQSLYHSVWEIPDHTAWPPAPEGEYTDILREIMDMTKSKL
ncbi:peroxisomal trans-2-enoyl-CoA reductase-like, partial [Sinocyclocheilus grahami]|uniref:peroxisomal trans-2-enoyl-CoA reductase-like n=1 Tax=Sinocyclocheilus grahami TaxID=75366 RepID=UPI0007AD6682